VTMSLTAEELGRKLLGEVEEVCLDDVRDRENYHGDRRGRRLTTKLIV